MSSGCHNRGLIGDPNLKTLLCVVEELLNAFRPLGCEYQLKAGWATGTAALRRAENTLHLPILLWPLSSGSITYFSPFDRDWHKAGTKAENTYKVTLIPNFRGDLAIEYEPPSRAALPWDILFHAISGSKEPSSYFLTPVSEGRSTEADEPLTNT